MLIMLNILWFALLEKQGGCWDIFTWFGFHTQNETMRFTIADTQGPSLTQEINTSGQGEASAFNSGNVRNW